MPFAASHQGQGMEVLNNYKVLSRPILIKDWSPRTGLWVFAQRLVIASPLSVTAWPGVDISSIACKQLIWNNRWHWQSSGTILEHPLHDAR